MALTISGIEGVLKGNSSVGNYVVPKDYISLSKAIEKMACQKM